MSCECTWTAQGFFVTSSTAAAVGLFPFMALLVNAGGASSSSLLLASPLVIGPSGAIAYSTGQEFVHAMNPDGSFLNAGVFSHGGGSGGNDLLPAFSRSGCF